MKNITWRRIAMILAVVVAGMVMFGVGVMEGSTRTAEFMVEKVAQVMGYENISIDITRAELMEYFLKLKGGA